MRLAGKAKAGFYPTPERVVEMILGYLCPTPGCQVLDPCAGEGVALQRIADYLRGAPQAVELSRERALACRRRGLKTYQGDALTYRGRGFGLLYLNPPYDDGAGERLERTFLKHWSEALVPGGVLVYVIPERIVEAVEDYLTSWYGSLLVLRFPEPEYRAFRQVVVFGVRRKEAATPGRLEVQGVLGEGAHEPYPVPLSGVGRVEGAACSPQEMLALAERSPLLAEGREVGEMRPLLPVKEAHLALLIAGGMLNNQVIAIEGEPYLLRGQVRKTRVAVEENDGERERRVERERFTVSVVALSLKSGKVLEIQ